ncbi:uncharacterized protein [Amphiura filiformis]|uniref:uncharacterized protein n=1 Tax=Amphiura filiformis TaxID=82378 RepID=UPI003B2191E0
MSDLLCKIDFHRYDAKENCWIRLYSMNVVRNSFPMVYLDGYIYAIGGSNDYGNEISDVERFDLSTERWEILPPLPEICRSISAVAFKGKIIVHGIDLYASQEKYILQVYHPNSKHWQSVHSEDHEVDRHGSINPPHLHVYKDVCYRVSYVNSQCDKPVERYCTTKHKHKPVVHALEVHPQSNAAEDDILVKVGESINQEHIPENMVGAFRIADEVFVSVNGFSYNTGISISSDQITDVDVDQWKPFSDSKGHGGMICSFTFDRKELEKEVDWEDIPFE